MWYEFDKNEGQTYEYNGVTHNYDPSHVSIDLSRVVFFERGSDFENSVRVCLVGVSTPVDVWMSYENLKAAIERHTARPSLTPKGEVAAANRPILGGGRGSVHPTQEIRNPPETPPVQRTEL